MVESSLLFNDRVFYDIDRKRYSLVVIVLDVVSLIVENEVDVIAVIVMLVVSVKYAAM
jgi:hypothetical protein